MAESVLKESAETFVRNYYNAFDSDRFTLRPFYRQVSMMSWESDEVTGVDNILSKLTSLPFSKVQHMISTVDAQPSSPLAANYLICATGLLRVDDGEHPLQFHQVFHLVLDEDKVYYILNDMFRLNLV